MALQNLAGLLPIAVTGLALTASITTASAADITGAGATFPAPVYAKWAEVYKAKTGNAVNYQAIGSGGGVKQIKGKTVDFGAIGRSDAGRRSCRSPASYSSRR